MSPEQARGKAADRRLLSFLEQAMMVSTPPEALLR